MNVHVIFSLSLLTSEWIDLTIITNNIRLEVDMVLRWGWIWWKNRERKDVGLKYLVAITLGQRSGQDGPGEQHNRFSIPTTTS